MTHAKKIAAFVAMGLLMAVSTASAQQKKSSITSGGEITFKTQTTDQGEFGPTGSVSSKFTEYRTMPNGTSIPSLNLWSTGGHVQFRLFANNIQQRDQRYQGDVKAHGMKLKFDVNSISHDMGADARTIFNRTGCPLFRYFAGTRKCAKPCASPCRSILAYSNTNFTPSTPSTDQVAGAVLWCVVKVSAFVSLM